MDKRIRKTSFRASARAGAQCVRVQRALARRAMLGRIAGGFVVHVLRLQDEESGSAIGSSSRVASCAFSAASETRMFTL